MHRLARWKLRAVKPYVPGKPIEELAREKGVERIYKLASNENPLGASPKAMERVKQRLDEIALYPDDSIYELTHKLSKISGFKPEEIVFGNGSVELLLYLYLGFVNPGESVIAPKYTFIMYKVLGEIVGANVIEPEISSEGYVDLERVLDSIRKDTKIVFIANPNNPTGNIIPESDIKEFMERVPEDILIVFDEAYYEYASFIGEKLGQAFLSGMEFLRKGWKNVVVLRTFSKIYGLAGLRIGYGFADKEIVEIIRKVHLPFNLNRLAQIAALGALDDEEFVKKSLDINWKGMRFLKQGFDEMGIKWYPSFTNFIMIEFKDREKAMKVHSVLEDAGIIVRPLNPYGLDNCLRITIGTEEANRKLIERLKVIV